MSENGEIYTAGKNFTLPPALTGWTNSTSLLEGDFFISGLDLNFMGSAVGIIIIKIGHCGLALLI